MFISNSYIVLQVNTEQIVCHLSALHLSAINFQLKKKLSSVKKISKPDHISKHGEIPKLHIPMYINQKKYQT